MPSSEPTAAHSEFAYLDKLDWAKLYRRLEIIIKGLKNPDDSPSSFARALRSARRAETQVAVIYTNISRLLAGLKDDLRKARLIYKIRLKSIVSDPEYLAGHTAKERAMFAEAESALEGDKIELAEVRLSRVLIFRDCINKALSTIKHYREDIGRRIRLIDVSREIGEQ